jgi:hypothetical protein
MRTFLVKNRTMFHFPAMTSPPRRFSLLHQLLWHWMMGMTLGILCAGLLLFTNAPGLADHLTSLSARLIFLLSVGFSFGVGATLTGAMLHICGDC